MVNEIVFHLPMVLLQIILVYAREIEGVLVRRWSPKLSDMSDPFPLTAMGSFAFAPDGTLFICARDKIEVFDPRGTFVKSFGARGTGNGEFNTPRSVALSEEGSLYVVDQGRKISSTVEALGN